MAGTVLVDTDIAIDFLRGVDAAKNLLLNLWKKNAPCLSILSVYELYAGMQAKEKTQTNDFIQACHVEPLTITITEQAAEFYQRYRKKGVTLTTVDCLIWATAHVNQHKLATRNFKHYPEKDILL